MTQRTSENNTIVWRMRERWEDRYHAQIMNGGLIRRIPQYKDVTAHYHAAGVPGRGELEAPCCVSHVLTAQEPG